jgi:sugar phosphate isomerase/epimerase
MLATSKIALSNIAWDESKDSAVVRVMKDKGFNNLEVSPFRSTSDVKKVAKYLRSLKAEEFNIVAFQSLMYRQPIESIFAGAEARKKISNYLFEVLDIAASSDVKTVIFGSPKNKLRGLVDIKEADIIARDFFANMAEAAEYKGITFCIEPTPDQYGADYITSTASAVELVRSVGHKSLKINLDLGAVILSGEDIQTIIRDNYEYIGHVHISEPFLKPIDMNPDFHRMVAQALKECKYSGYISIEMLSNQDLSVSKIGQIVQFVTGQYQIVYD